MDGGAVVGRWRRWYVDITIVYVVGKLGSLLYLDTGAMIFTFAPCRLCGPVMLV